MKSSPKLRIALRWTAAAAFAVVAGLAYSGDKVDGLSMAHALPAAALSGAAVRRLKASKADEIKAARAITDLAAKEARDLTEDEQTKFDAHLAKAKSIDAQIEREEMLAAQEAGMGTGRNRGTAMEVPDGATIEVGDHQLLQDPNRGFRSFGEFAQLVRGRGMSGGQLDERLAINEASFRAATPSTFGNEATGEDGAFAIPPGFSTSIWQLSLSEDSLLPLTDNTEISNLGMAFPKDETTPWGTDGVRAYWGNEAGAMNATKPKLGVQNMRLNKLHVLVPMTDELLRDAPALGSYLQPLAGRSIRWKTNEAIFNGNGDGQPLGAALNTGPAIVIAKESGQATGTLQPINLAKMIARLPEGSFERSFWMINQDVLPYLFTLTLGNYPIYLPPTEGMKGNPYGMLLGRPIRVSQHAASFSSEGDIQLHDLSYYRTITQAGGIETATSMHLYFDAGATAFRFTFRVDGAPKLKSAINPAKGSNTMSPFVLLGAR